MHNLDKCREDFSTVRAHTHTTKENNLYFIVQAGKSQTFYLSLKYQILTYITVYCLVYRFCFEFCAFISCVYILQLCTHRKINFVYLASVHIL